MIHTPAYKPVESNPDPVAAYMAFGLQRPSGPEISSLLNQFRDQEERTPLIDLANAQVCIEAAYMTQNPELTRRMIGAADDHLESAQSSHLAFDAPIEQRRAALSARLWDCFMPRVEMLTMGTGRTIPQAERQLHIRLANVLMMKDVNTALTARDQTEQRVLLGHARELAFHALISWNNACNGVELVSHPSLLRQQQVTSAPRNEAVIGDTPFEGVLIKLINSYDQPGAEGIQDRYQRTGTEVVSVIEDMAGKSLKDVAHVIVERTRQESTATGTEPGGLEQRFLDRRNEQLDAHSNALMRSLGFNV